MVNVGKKSSFVGAAAPSPALCQFMGQKIIMPPSHWVQGRWIIEVKGSLPHPPPSPVSMPQTHVFSDEEEEEENLDDQDEQGNLKGFINDDDDEEGEEDEGSDSGDSEDDVSNKRKRRE